MTITQLTKIMCEDILLNEQEVSWTLEIKKQGNKLKLVPKLLTSKVLIPKIDDEGEFSNEMEEFVLNKPAPLIVINENGEETLPQISLNSVFINLETGRYSLMFNVE